jgi:hypothetical protein
MIIQRTQLADGDQPVGQPGGALLMTTSVAVEGLRVSPDVPQSTAVPADGCHPARRGR